MGNLGNELQKHAKRLGIDRQVEAVGVVEEATKVIARYIPREDFEVVSFKDGVLKIKAKSTSVSTEIINSKNNLKKIGVDRIVFTN